MPWVLTRGERRRRNRLQGGRLHLGTVADIKSERWPTSSRNRWPACVGIRSHVSGLCCGGSQAAGPYGRCYGASGGEQASSSLGKTTECPCPNSTTRADPTGFG